MYQDWQQWGRLALSMGAFWLAMLLGEIMAGHDGLDTWVTGFLLILAGGLLLPVRRRFDTGQLVQCMAGFLAFFSALAFMLVYGVAYETFFMP